jgi:hypothetical protein
MLGRLSRPIERSPKEGGSIAMITARFVSRVFSVCVVAVTLTLSGLSVAKADIQPTPAVGAQITLTQNASAGVCFDSLQNLRLSEQYLDKWSGDKMDTFLSAHSVVFNGGEKAKVLAVNPTFTWNSDYVKPIHLAVERIANGIREETHWQGRTCWWEFSQNPDMLPQFTWWK